MTVFNIYFLNYCLIIIEGIFLVYKPQANNQLTQQQKDKRKLHFVVIACIQWILISGLRADVVGMDTINYLQNFDSHCKLPWDSVLRNMVDYYKWGGLYDYFEPGYLLYERLMGAISTNHEFYKFSVAIIFMAAFGRFVYKNAQDPVMSFALYSSFFYNMFSLTGYRQVLSVSIGILWAYEYVKNRNLIKFIIAVLIASTIHKSTLMFLPFYFLANLKISKKYMFAVAAVAMFFLIFKNRIFSIVSMLVGYDEYSALDVGSPITFTIFLGIIYVLVVAKYNDVIQITNTKHINQYYNGFFIAVMIVFAAYVNPTAMRMVYDFLFMLMPLLGEVLKSFKRQENRTCAYLLAFLALGSRLLYGATPYMFFWEDTMRFYR